MEAEWSGGRESNLEVQLGKMAFEKASGAQPRSVVAGPKRRGRERHLRPPKLLGQQFDCFVQLGILSASQLAWINVDRDIRLYT